MRCPWRKMMVLSLLAGLVPLLPVGVAVADDATVGDGASDSCTEAAFNDALAAALTNGGGTITFDCGGRAIIEFTDVKTITAGNTVVIDGAGLITLDGAGATRLFNVDGGATLELRSINLINGNDASDLDPTDPGGAVNVVGTLRVFDSAFDNNVGGLEGGAIDIDGGSVEITGGDFRHNFAVHGGVIDVGSGSLTVTGNSTFTNNDAVANGGAIYAGTDATLTISESSFTSNETFFGDGGAIYSNSTLSIAMSSFFENVAFDSGGAIDNDGGGSTTIRDSRFFGNEASGGGSTTTRDSRLLGNQATDGDGGAIDNESTLNVTRTLFDGNFSFFEGGAIWTDDATVTITDSEFNGNYTEDIDGGAIMIAGGSVSTTVTNVEFIDNESFEDGGAISVFGGVLDISNSLFDGNESIDGDGGALDPDGGVTTIAETSFIGNVALEDGGAIDFDADEVDGSLTIIRSTFYNNETGGDGGALHLDGTLATIETSTISGNTSGGEEGGGIYSDNVEAFINNSTITDNHAGGGAGIYRGDEGPVTLTNTIVAENNDEDCGGGMTSNGYNLDSDDSCDLDQSTDIPAGNADLGQLADNGGPTLTHMPSLTSDAIDTGPSTCPSPDQRGATRPSGPACDIGAVEVPITVCANPYTGALSGSQPDGSCPPATTALSLPGDDPVTLCINSYTGALTWSPSGNCAPTLQAHVVPDDGPLSYCQTIDTGRLRYTPTGACMAREESGVFPGTE